MSAFYLAIAALGLIGGLCWVFNAFCNDPDLHGWVARLASVSLACFTISFALRALGKAVAP